MKYILDTNIISYYFKNNNNVVKNLFKIGDNDSITTTIANYAEIMTGVFYNENLRLMKKMDIENYLSSIEILSFDKESAYLFSQIKADLILHGTIIEDFDIMIASICLKHDAILVTNNLKHFIRIKGLRLENWAE
jgi:predicted nucleic acid-binding protein